MANISVERSIADDALLSSLLPVSVVEDVYRERKPSIIWYANRVMRNITTAALVVGG